MDQVSAKLENELSRYTRDAKNIMLLALIGILMPPLFIAALLYFLLYSSKRNRLKSDQTLSHIFDRLDNKTTKELRSIRLNSNSIDSLTADTILAHKTMVVVLISIGVVLTIMIAFIGLSYLMGWGP